MKYEYLIFNIIVISGPLFFGSLKKYYFLNHAKNAIASITISAIPFLIWDFAVADRHWFFAEKYTIGLRLFGLPIEEILFFFTVPYACLFTWQMIKIHFKPKTENTFIDYRIQFIIAALFIVFSITALILKLEYTAIASFYFALSLLVDKYFGANIFITKKFWIYFGFVTFFTLIFNGYLTWRPIVTYDEIHQLSFRIFTIPVEDFFFGFALMILATTLFEKMISHNK